MAVGWAAERRGFTHRRSANNRARLVPDALTFERWIGRISRFGWRHSPQLKCAIRAVLIVFRDFLLALRAGRMQVALAVGAVIEARPDHLAALGACVRERLSHQEVKNEANCKIRRRKDDDEKSPESRAHSAAFRVAIHVGDHENVACEEKRL